MLLRFSLVVLLVALAVCVCTAARIDRRGALFGVDHVDADVDVHSEHEVESHIDSHVEAVADVESEAHHELELTGSCAGSCINMKTAHCASGHLQHGVCPGAATIVCCLSGAPEATEAKSQPMASATDAEHAAASGVDFAKLNGMVPAPLMAELSDVVTRYKLNTPLRLAHFLSQASHESGHFSVLSENLHYKSASLLKVFPKYFKTAAAANAVAGNPEKIANIVYASRMGNGNTASGDGYKYRGRGYIQITGKSAYASYGKYRSIDAVGNPDLLAGQYALDSAAWFFSVFKPQLLRAADGGSGSANVLAVTKLVNGGTNGLADRQALFTKFYNALK